MSTKAKTPRTRTSDAPARRKDKTSAEGGLSAVLAEIDACVARVRGPDVAKSLGRPVRAATLERLGDALFGGAVPADVATWFKWHDGQTWLASGIDPERPAIRLLSAREAMDEWRALNETPDKMLPWDDRWLPLATNGGGDFYCLVARGPKAGTLIFYLHDDARRTAIAKSLVAFASAMLKSLHRRDQPKPTFRFGAPTAPLKDAKPPTLKDLAAAPIGTLFYRRVLPYGSYFTRIYVKVSKAAWIKASARPRQRLKGEYPLDAALAAVKKCLASKSPSEWSIKPSAVVAALSDAQVFPRGVPALAGRDPKKDGYLCRKATRLALA